MVIKVGRSSYKVSLYSRGGTKSPTLLVLQDTFTGVRYTPYAMKKAGIQLTFVNLMQINYGSVLGDMVASGYRASWFNKIPKDDSWKGGRLMIPVKQ